MSRKSYFQEEGSSSVDSITWAIIKQIVQECGRRGERIDKDLVCFTLKMVFQDPKFGFNESVPLSKDDVSKLITFCLQKLMNDQGPIMETIRMQCLFTRGFMSHKEIISGHHQDLEDKMLPLTREIIDSQARGKSALDALYNKVVTLLVLRSGLGSPTSGKVLREAAGAVHSVFPPAELTRFMGMIPLDKKAHLRELSNVVAGIRLFNWDCKKGGSGIEDLPTVLNTAVDATLKNMEALGAYTADKAHRLTATTEKFLYTDAGSMVPEDHRQLIKYGLANIRQFQVYLKKITEEVKLCSSRLSDLDQDLLSRLTDLHSGLSNRLAIPSVQAFPLLVRLSKSWQGFQNEMVVLSHLNSLLKSLYNHTRCLAELTNGFIHLNEGMSIASDEERNSFNCKGKINTENFICSLITPGHVPNYDDLPLYASGFCPVALVSGQGFVLPGNPQLGLIEYEDKYFSVSTLDRAEQFGSNPKLFLSAIQKLIRESPVLLRLLNLEEESGEPLRPMTADRGAQTEVHLVDRLKDPKYHWNEWELRQEALQLADLRKKATHSTQTISRGNLMNSSTQVFPKLDSATQTVVDSSVETLPQRSIILGLRGESDMPVEHVLLDDILLGCR